MEIDEKDQSSEKPEEVGNLTEAEEAPALHNGDASEGPSTVSKNRTANQTILTTMPKNNAVANKQLVVQKKIEQYFHRLTQGCNRPNCANPNCISNSSQKRLPVNEAAVKAIQLLRQKAEICPLLNESTSEVLSDKEQGASSSSTTNHVTVEESKQKSIQDEHASMDTKESTSGMKQLSVSDPDTISMGGQPVKKSRQNEHISMDTNESTSEMEQLSVSDPDALSIGRQPQSSSLSNILVDNDVVNQTGGKTERKKEQKDNMRVLKVEEVKYLNEEMVVDLIKQCREEEGRRNMETGNEEKHDTKDPYLPLFRSLTEVFNNMEGLNRSFLLQKQNDDDVPDERSETVDQENKMEIDPLSESQSPKETYVDSQQIMETESQPVSQENAPLMSILQSLSGTEDSEMNLLTGTNSSLQRSGAIKKKAIGTKSKTNNKEHVTVLQPTVDIEMVRRVYQKLDGIEKAGSALVSSLDILSLNIDAQLNVMRQLKKTVVNLNVFVTIMENPFLHSPEYLESAFPCFCRAMASLPLEAKADLAKWWSTYEPTRLLTMVQSLQQLLTYKVLTQKLSNEDSEQEQLDLHTNDTITSTVKCLKILYYASLFGGKVDKDRDHKPRPNTPGTLASGFNGDGGLDPFEKTVWNDPLGQLLDVTDKDSEEALVPLEEFQNELLNDTFDLYNDFTSYITEKVNKRDRFSFIHYPFILNTLNKTTYLFYDNKIQMLSGRRMMVLQRIFQGTSVVSPYLRLKIRRDHVIDDSLVRLELIALENPRDLRKQLYVEFEGEQGVDEGGVSKEFFQLVVDQIFNPDYGMFTYNKDTNFFWFNSHSFESKAQYTLIGIVLGLAIYNNCILDIKFPPVVYKKLLGKKGRFRDMKQSHPDLYTSLGNLLEYDGDVENDIMATFRVNYSDMFGTHQSFDLKPDGENIPVTKDNRQEYVDLYTDWLLNGSIVEQFGAFRHGFELVVSESPLKYMFRIEELEVLISGSQEYDFNLMESTTDYDGGFTKDSQTVKDFWSVVHDMSEEDKRKLLQFTTGTDRAPVGGLSQVKLVIARNGPDSNRLPTAHTCFNVILLPDYKNREKLRERLHKAITYAKGFGML